MLAKAAMVFILLGSRWYVRGRNWFFKDDTVGEMTNVSMRESDTRKSRKSVRLKKTWGWKNALEGSRW